MHDAGEALAAREERVRCGLFWVAQQQLVRGQLCVPCRCDVFARARPRPKPSHCRPQLRPRDQRPLPHQQGRCGQEHGVAGRVRRESLCSHLAETDWMANASRAPPKK